jgi:hypothetical protein
MRAGAVSVTVSKAPGSVVRAQVPCMSPILVIY